MHGDFCALYVKTCYKRSHKHMIYNIILTLLFADNQAIEKSYNNQAMFK